MTDINADDFKRGMRHLAAAVNVVSTLADGAPCGMLATAVCSVCAEPPTLLVCINRDASMHDAVVERGAFCVNVLDERHFDTACHFLSFEGAERFSLCEWDTLATGAPAIVDALVNFDAEVTERVEVGTHTIFFGRVVAVRCKDDGQPLLYHDGNYAALKPDPLRPQT